MIIPKEEDTETSMLDMTVMTIEIIDTNPTTAIVVAVTEVEEDFIEVALEEEEVVVVVLGVVEEEAVVEVVGTAEDMVEGIKTTRHFQQCIQECK